MSSAEYWRMEAASASRAASGRLGSSRYSCPPGTLTPFARDLQELFAVRSGDPVHVQEGLELEDADPHLGGLHAGDRRRRERELLRYLLDGETGVVTKLAQLARQPALAHRRARHGGRILLPSGGV